MKPSIKHNKLRNTGILFELLVRQITSDVMENKKDGIAVKLMREFFNSKKELGKELMLYRAFFNVQNLSEQKAFQLLRLVSEQRKSLDQRALNTQKYLLIKEIKSNFNLKEFFSARIPSYKIYASIYKNFDSAANGMNEITNIEELANSQFTIVEHLSGKTTNKEIKESNELATIIRSQEDDIRFLAYKILIERFNEKYKGLDEAQKKLLQEYIYNISNTSKLKTYTQTESQRLATELSKLSSKVKDKVVSIKLSEVISQLTKIKSAQVIKENHMTAMLIGYEILKELKTL
tara:strand:+ start:392 stop:1264 length:873 start_codon:yes stop_codon:yes gene_type:complete